MRYYRPLSPIRDVVRRMLPQMERQRVPGWDAWVADWPRVVGAVLARYSRPLKCQDGVLWIGVDHPIHLYELRQRYAPEVLREAQGHLGPQSVSSIRWTIQQPERSTLT